MRSYSPLARKSGQVWVRTPAGGRGSYDADLRGPMSGDLESKRVWASLEKTPDDVIAEVDLTIVLDFIHVSEYVWKASLAFFGEKQAGREDWVEERLSRILCGHASQVAAGIRRSATRRGMTKYQREPVDTCANYLLGHTRFLRYDQYLAAGLPIATGVVEGACRHLVADRMDLTGARWSLAGAEAVLRLRALRSSGDFDDYWRFHEQREYDRNHASRYQDGNVVPIRGRHLSRVK